jgi:hypothetical protein
MLRVVRFICGSAPQFGRFRDPRLDENVGRADIAYHFCPFALDSVSSRSHRWLPAGPQWPEWCVRRITASRVQCCTSQESRMVMAYPADGLTSALGTVPGMQEEVAEKIDVGLRKALAG